MEAQTRGQAREDYLAWTEQPPVIPGTLQYGEVMAWLRNRLPEDAIVTNGAGNYAIWVGRFLRFRALCDAACADVRIDGLRRCRPPSAPSGIPDRTVVCFAGDGCFLMNGQEFATAVQYDLPIIVVVVDNGMYGTIRMHQEREYPGRVVGDGAEEPRFRGLRPRLRRPWRAGRDHRPVRAGL